MASILDLIHEIELLPKVRRASVWKTATGTYRAGILFWEDSVKTWDSLEVSAKTEEEALTELKRRWIEDLKENNG